MKKITNIAVALLCCGSIYGQAKTAVSPALAAETNTYAKIINSRTESHRGFIAVHRNGEKLFFEIPQAMLGRELLLGERVSRISSNRSISAGQMYANPLLIRFEKDNGQLFLYKADISGLSTNDEELKESFDRNYVTPVYAAFGIEAYGPDSSAVIDVTRFFENDIPDLSAFSEKSKPTGTLDTKASGIINVKAFSKNVELKSRFLYTGPRGFYVELNRSLLLLDKEPMKKRRASDQVGYFKGSDFTIGLNCNGADSKKHINRWRIEPRPEDVERYKRGELVEPAKPIVYYVDNALPDKYRGAVKEGIEEWQKAFEAIGFKNAIIARDVPLNDPDFDMDDITNSCFRYIANLTSNATGPSWVDPRSGEIIQGDVMWYHNMANLLYKTRFVQTAAVDEKMRTPQPNEEVLLDAIRYAVAHEIGHTLGLEHNMGSSNTIPVDSLRSATFTQRYGTTHSIMDYARFNYVAQPGDQGVKLTPPRLGEYDMWAIAYGYKPIFEEEEERVLDKWLAEAKKNPMLRYGAETSMGNTADPRDLMEDLGDDPVRASVYGINNLQLINSRLTEWFGEEGESYKRILDLQREVRNQYTHLLKSVSALIGNAYKESLRQGDPGFHKTTVCAERQREALNFLFEQLRKDQQWLDLQELMEKNGNIRGSTQRLHSDVMGWLINETLFQDFIENQELTARGGTAYSLPMYLKDLHTKVWGGKADHALDRELEMDYLTGLLPLIRETTEKNGKSDAANLQLKSCLLEELARVEKVVNKRMKSAEHEWHYHYADLLRQIRTVTDKYKS